MASSIVETVREHARQQPERPAIIFDGEVTSYGSLYADVERFARALLQAGLRPGDRVGLFLENSPAFAIAYLGAHLAGGVVTLINTQYRQTELSHILTDAEVRFCVTSPSGVAELQPLLTSRPAHADRRRPARASDRRARRRLASPDHRLRDIPAVRQRR